MFGKKWTYLWAALFLVGPVWAGDSVCEGTDLYAELPEAEQQAVDAAGDVAFSKGVMWRAQKDGAEVILVGTSHLPHPRHDQTLATLAPVWPHAAALYVEATQADQGLLQEKLKSEPDLMFDLKGPSLPERLADKDWDILSSEMELRGMPPFISARLRPWFVSLSLAMSPCMTGLIQSGKARGLDLLLEQAAAEHQVPVRSLEPWTTVFDIFNGMSPKDEVLLLRASALSAPFADDYMVTLNAAYAEGAVGRIWAFMQAHAERLLQQDGVGQADLKAFDVIEDRMLARRNQVWVGVIDKAAKQAARDQVTVVAFGALHLIGEHGVPALLQEQGWTVRPYDDGKAAAHVR